MRNENVSDQISPLLQIELQFVAIIIHMRRIGYPLTPSNALALINDALGGKDTSVNRRIFTRSREKMMIRH